MSSLFGTLEFWLRRTQPFRSFYIGYHLVELVVFRIPSWFLCSFLKPLRPRRNWSFAKTFNFKIVRYVTSVWNMRLGGFMPKPVETITSLPVNLDQTVKAVWIEPYDNSLIQGDIKTFADKTGVETARVPGYWYHRELTETSQIEIPRARENERVGLMIHGGGFMMQSAHPNDISQNITRGILQYSECFSRILAVEYRRMYGIDEQTGPKAAKDIFPTQLLDTISAFDYLVSGLGFKPNNIIFIGDSAGGNLALALTRYLLSTSLEDKSQRPGGIILLSPWVDLGPSHQGQGSSYRKFVKTDYTGGIANLEKALIRGGQAYTHSFGTSFSFGNPYISAASKLLPAEFVSDGRLFEGYPPTLIISGGAELLLDPIRTLVSRMKESIGEENVQYLECDDAFHDFLMFKFAEPERTYALIVIADWLGKLKPN